MKQLSDNITASLALHMNIFPDISIIISFSQTQGPNTGSVCHQTSAREVSCINSP
jgi:hypothetical protein